MTVYVMYGEEMGHFLYYLNLRNQALTRAATIAVPHNLHCRTRWIAASKPVKHSKRLRGRLLSVKARFGTEEVFMKLFKLEKKENHCVWLKNFLTGRYIFFKH